MLRYLLRFRLATLLVIITLFCVAMAVRQAYRGLFGGQVKMAAHLVETGAEVRFETPKPEWLANVIGRAKYRAVVMLNLEGCGVRDRQLSILRDFPHFRQLYLASNPITDEGLKQIADLRSGHLLTRQHHFGTLQHDARRPCLSCIVPQDISIRLLLAGFVLVPARPWNGHLNGLRIADKCRASLVAILNHLIKYFSLLL